MKLFTRKALMLFIVIVSIILINNPAWCTDVGGIIDTNTTWDLAGSPYNIKETVQVCEPADSGGGVLSLTLGTSLVIIVSALQLTSMGTLHQAKI